MKIHVSAPGKIILHGEHAVVYGKAAIAMSLSLRTSLTLTSHEDNKVVLNLVNMKLQKEWDLQLLNDVPFCGIAGDVIPASEECILKITEAFELPTSTDPELESQRQAIIAFLYLWIHVSKCYNIGSFPPCAISVDSELAVGAGMGSSASYSVCLAAATLIVCGRITPQLLPEDKELINKWAFQAEKIFHGKPSGIDNSVCTYGGAVLFENGIVVDILPEMHQMQTLLVNTKVSRNTKMLIAKAKQKQELHTTVFNHVMEAIQGISTECWTYLKNSANANVSTEQQKIQSLVQMNHHLLNCLGVGHPKLDKIYEIADRHHCAAKLTGAGGGGCAIIMLPIEDQENSLACKLTEELQSCGFEVWDILMGCSGVQVKFQNTD